ncbi:hypothetical protein AYK26_02385 [Euryarchaeota archaeon SM23-78]|nr:MAG: hypothetical protein AYK26_02385 [Euryarchaeota archaeon SM23-78]MBW3000871.1 hypothetical protein [Candidatus Woesearchaeota archaeon]
MKILIVEDQKFPLESLESAVESVMPKADYDIAKWYKQAEELIETKKYDLVILDHRMPYEDPGCTEDTDEEKFFASLREIGYTLIPVIKKKDPKTIVIGTSSLEKSLLEKYKPGPDYQISKMYGEAETELKRVMEEIQHKEA